MTAGIDIELFDKNHLKKMETIAIINQKRQEKEKQEKIRKDNEKVNN